MLIKSHRPTARDLEVWAARERSDELYAKTDLFRRRRDRANAELRAFLDRGPAYVSVSWGKDSVCVAHMARCLDSSIPLVWVTIEGETNPDCARVRDAFLWVFPGPYREELVVRKTESGKHGTLLEGMRIASSALGTDRYVSGVRAQESSVRAMSRTMHGHATERTCRPIIDWKHEDVFAYLWLFGLPVHPSYACSMGGAIDRGRIRVGPLGGERGTGFGRAEWERMYYGEALS